MPKIKNVSPRGDLDVPLLRRTVAHGAVVDVTKEQADRLLDQPENWQPVREPAPAKPKTPSKPKPAAVAAEPKTEATK